MIQNDTDQLPEVVMAITHNLRENLANIKGISELMSAPDLETDYKHWMEIIQRNATAAIYELSNLLTWYHPVPSNRVDISVLLSTANTSLQVEARTRNVNLLLNIPIVPMWVSGFESALKEVLMMPLLLAVFGSKQDSRITAVLKPNENVAIFSVSTDDTNGIPAYLSRSAYSSIPEHPELRSGMGYVLTLVRQLGGQCDFRYYDKRTQSIKIELPLATG